MVLFIWSALDTQMEHFSLRNETLILSTFRPCFKIILRKGGHRKGLRFSYL